MFWNPVIFFITYPGILGLKITTGSWADFYVKDRISKSKIAIF